MRTILRFGVLLVTAGIAFSVVACSSTSSSGGAMNMAGTWTITAVSTKGHGSFSGTASLSQSGTGVGINGATTLTATIGSISVSQTGTSLTGTLTNSMKKLSYNFIGTLSGSTFTINGSTTCDPGGTISTSIAGTITSNNANGTYTLTDGCYSYYNDAGTFVATKQ